MRDSLEMRSHIGRTGTFIAATLIALAAIIQGLTGVTWVAISALLFAGLVSLGVVWRSSKRPAETSALRLLLIGSLAVIPPAMASGGLRGSAMFWLLCAPFFALEFLPYSKAALVLIGEMALMALLGMPSLWQGFVPEFYDEASLTATAAIDHFGLFLTMSALTYLSVHSRRSLGDKLESQNLMLGRILQISGHDMANAINIMDASLRQVSQRRDKLPEHQRERGDDDALARISRQIFQLKAQLGKTRQLARWHSQIELERVPLELSELLSDAWQQCEPLWRRKNVSVHINPNLRGIYVQSDEVILSQQALQNFFSNAIKFSPEGGRVWVHAQTQGAFISVGIEDEGQGIHEDILAQLGSWEPVSSTHGTMGELGTGFGLRIALDLLKALGIKASLHNKAKGSQPKVPFDVAAKGQGTLVLLNIPLAEWQPESATQHKAPRQAA